MNLTPFNILHADDDTDDFLFIKEALDELQLPTHQTWVHDGEQLMQLLTDETNELPHVLFLDLNMPRKNGFECLLEIKLSEKLKQLPVIVFSTSFEQDIVNLLYKNGAHYYIRKPSEFSQFKKIVQQAFISIISQENISQPTKEDFVFIMHDN